MKHTMEWRDSTLFPSPISLFLLLPSLTIFLPPLTLYHKLFFFSFLLRPESIVPSSFNMHILIRMSTLFPAARLTNNLTQPTNPHIPRPIYIPSDYPNFSHLSPGISLSILPSTFPSSLLSKCLFYVYILK
jgi:hypothetical protein